MKDLSGFSSVTSKWPELDLDNLLGEMSRLNGIMNIEPGADADELQATFLRRLAERGIEVTAEQFSSITEPLKIYAIPDHLHALSNMLGDGLVPSMQKQISCTYVAVELYECEMTSLTVSSRTCEASY